MYNNNKDLFFAEMFVSFSFLGVSSLFAFKDKKVFELMKYKENYRSWFIDQTVQKGSDIQ